jgi:hypothetical protein
MQRLINAKTVALRHFDALVNRIDIFTEMQQSDERRRSRLIERVRAEEARVLELASEMPRFESEEAARRALFCSKFFIIAINDETKSLHLIEFDYYVDERELSFLAKIALPLIEIYPKPTNTDPHTSIIDMVNRALHFFCSLKHCTY